jgi:hypothetical protein
MCPIFINQLSSGKKRKQHYNTLKEDMAMNYYALDEALAYINEEQDLETTFLSLVEFSAKEFNENTALLEEYVILEGDDETKKKTLWNKIIEAIKDAIDFVKTRLQRFISVALAKLQQLSLDAIMTRAKKADKNHLLGKYRVYLLNFEDLERKMKDFFSKEDVVKSEDVSKIETDVNYYTLENAPKAIYKSIKAINTIKNDMDKFISKYYKIYEKAKEQNDEDLDGIRENLITGNALASAAYSNLKDFSAAAANLGKIYKAIIDNPDGDNDAKIKSLLNVEE